MVRLITTLVLGVVFNNVLSDTNYRLNTPVKPHCYYLTISPHFQSVHGENTTNFDGLANIILSTSNNTNQIQMHSKNLKFSASNITVTGNKTVNTVTSVEFDTKYDFVYINLQYELQAGVEYTIEIAYTGVPRKDYKGYFMDTYKTHVNETLVSNQFIATLMQPTSARTVFPCFDEPAYKAVFTLVIDRPSGFKPSATNMKLYKSLPLSNGYVREVFYPSPKMSTYQVAFLISDFETSRSEAGKFGIYTRPNAKNQTEYALDFGVKALDFLSDYFGIDYYSTDLHMKLDHVALPHYSSGAMENWGLAMYREYRLLYDPEQSTPFDKLIVSQILAHETAHMWFGNLVTCHWWSDVWLNEGFANYFQNYLTEIIKPEMRAADSMVSESVHSAYSDDESPASPAISNDVNSPEEIENNFGTTTYSKAGSVIRMMHHLLGDKAFRFGLQHYLKENQFNVGYPEKLYASLQQAAINASSLAKYPGADVASVMGPWVTQPGHPILTVNVDYETETVLLTQKRFYINSLYESNEIYPIPITYATEQTPDFYTMKPVFIMNERSHLFNLTGLRAAPWVIFNIQETGFYRVNYNKQGWEKIASALKGDQREVIHHLNRAKIVNDLFSFVEAGVVDIELLYDILEFLSEETNFSVWKAAIKGLDNLRTSKWGTPGHKEVEIVNDLFSFVEAGVVDIELLYDILEFLSEETNFSVWKAAIKGLDNLRTSKWGTPGHKEVEARALRLMGGIISKLGFHVRSTDDFSTLRNRLQVLEFACKLGHQGCIDNAVAQFKSFKDNGTEISPSLRPVVYCFALRHGTVEDDLFLHQRLFYATNLSSEIRMMYGALRCPEDHERLKNFYEITKQRLQMKKK